MHICHVTDVHPASDPRIAYKEAGSAAAAGHRVTLVAPDGPEPPPPHVEWVTVRREDRRAFRMTLSACRTMILARRQQADIYHLHDPELLLWAPILMGNGRHVLFDMHEDVGAQVATKHWIPVMLRRPVAALSQRVVAALAARLDGTVHAHPYTPERYPSPHHVVVQNFPPRPSDMTERSTARPGSTGFTLVYIGSITPIRGLDAIMQALPLVPSTIDVRLILVGSISPDDYLHVLRGLPGWSRVDYSGAVPWDEARSILQTADAGIVMFQPAPNHVRSYPTKLYEYMSAALPVIASDFPAWRQLIEKESCGIVCDPVDPRAIADAITSVATSEDRGRTMGRAGLSAVKARYSWESQYAQLESFYKTIRQNHKS